MGTTTRTHDNKEAVTSSNTELKLQEELDRLKNLSKLGSKLRVAWAPSSNGPLSGEVRNNVIHIYESEESKAVDVLQHEFVDSVVSSILEPYKEVVNELIRLLNKNAYRQKEDVVEGLRRLILNTIEDGYPSERNHEEVKTRRR